MKVNTRLVMGTAFVLLAAAGLPLTMANHWEPNCPHGSPHSHTYSVGGSAGARSDSANAGRTAGVTTVSDGNLADCDGDFDPANPDTETADFDGDFEFGVGGAFFGFGPWAHEAVCDFGLTGHGGTVTVNDVVFGPDVQFTIGADDQDGPDLTPDPVTGEPACTTDGAITPCRAGDPCPDPNDPTRDPDDCLTPVIDGGNTAPPGTGSTCGAGGDGGYWVFLLGPRVHEQGGVPPAVDVNNPATAGTITA